MFMATHETPDKPSKFEAFGLGRIDQWPPLKTSVRFCPLTIGGPFTTGGALYWPTATQYADVTQLTAFRKLLLDTFGAFGLGITDQMPAARDSITV
jgi:hypothetical protein